MLPFNVSTIRLTLHVLAVSVWVGGQLTLLGLLPAVRSLGSDAGKRVARQFEKIAWPAFGLAIVTGIWNIAAVNMGSKPAEYNATLFAKLFFVAISGIAAFFHARATSKAIIAIGGAVGLLASLLALLYGVQLGKA